MPLHIKHELKRGRFKPIIMCDYCDEEIATAKAGNEQWQAGDDRIYFTHKQCSHAFELTRGGLWFADELGSMLVHLVDNLEVDMEQATKTAKMFNSI